MWLGAYRASEGARLLGATHPRRRAGLFQFGLEPDRRREGGGDEARLLRLFHGAHRPVGVRSGREGELRPEDDLREAENAVRAVDGSFGGHLACRELDPRSPRHGAQGEQEHRLDHHRSNRCSGLQASPGPSKSRGGAERSSGGPSAVTMT